MLTNNDTLKALYSTDLASFLEKANIKTAFVKGEIKCIYCNISMSENNLYALIPNNDHFDLCCTKAECIMNLSQEGEK